MFERVATAHSLSPPRASKTMGMNETPEAQQEAVWPAIFLASPMERA